MEVLDLKVITPHGVALDIEAEEVVVPGVNGEVGILPGHCAYIGLVKGGRLKYQPPGDSSISVEVAFGSVQVNEQGNVTLLVGEVKGG